MEKQERINELYTVALKVFSEYGYKKTTVEDIASEMSLTKGALYQYVASKKALYYEAVRYALQKWQNKVMWDSERETSAEKKFYVMCKTAFKYLQEEKVLRKILINDSSIFPMSDKDDNYKDINNNSMKYLKKVMEKGIAEKIFKPIDVEIMSELLYSMYKMLIIETYVLEKQDADKVLYTCIDMIAFGLLNK